MRDIFIGKPLHWLATLIIIAVLWGVGVFHLHVTQFNFFILLVLGLAVGALAMVVFGYRRGDRVMRDSIESGGNED